MAGAPLGSVPARALGRMLNRSVARARRARSRARSNTRRDARRDDGRAIIEVVFLAVLLLIPVIYILIAVLRLQAATLAVSQAARDTGRLIETSTGQLNAELIQAVARTDLQDQGISATGMQIRVVERGADCLQAPQTTASVQPGASYDLCVVAVVSLPGVPTVLAGTNNTVTGVYTVHIGQLRQGS